ncbi:MULTISPECIES: GNAT family N-acetyltransferase [Streptomyces]|uniref:GNAT family N-acetyltransferase n=1 Tax=Streptomyces edwardsiae TaxID=3075527 RepID=A0ABU2QDP0_9ACTN|nr:MULTISPECIES: GNAT family N-acetyltransferase [unclassified Streptomyces]MDT0402583.1 GNAT family N-acetyltransferase [Streptomyces sp. DSM 41635]
MSADIRIHTDARLLAHTDALRSVYVDAFCAPPWNEDEGRATEFADRLPTSVGRPGFTAATAVRDGETIGFATAWTTPDPFPTNSSYPQVTAGLGPAYTADWLCGALEVDELAVRTAARGTGVARDLLEAVTADAPDGRAWLLTWAQNPRALAFYRRQGWTQVTHPAPDGEGVVVFLGPRHPARPLAPLPL